MEESASSRPTARRQAWKDAKLRSFDTLFGLLVTTACSAAGGYFGSSLGGIGVVAGAVIGALIGVGIFWIVELFRAVRKQRDDARDRVEELEAGLEELSVDVASPGFYEAKSDAEDAGSLLVVIPSIRITNRSSDNRVSLGIRFVADAAGGELWINEASGQKWEQFAAGAPPDRLTTPLPIEPQDSQAGMLGFWLNEVFAGLIGPNLKAAAESGHMARINPRIEIEDFVSGKSITVPVPGEHP